MSWELYLGFVLASVVLMLIPGPNVSLIVANSIAYGTRYGLSPWRAPVPRWCCSLA